MDQHTHILVVDDEPEMRSAVSEYLELRGYVVSTAASGTEMRQVLAKEPVDLVLLDLGLPGEDGIVLTRELRAESQIGIIIVTALGETEDRVLGIESGADDYVVKPFSLRELLARIRGVMRRSSVEPRPTSHRGAGYDPGARTYLRTDGSVVGLSTGECDLLDLFLGNPDRPIHRDELVEKTAHRTWDPLDRSMDVRINRLRHKIENDPAHPQIIRTVRGVGYLFNSGE